MRIQCIIRDLVQCKHIIKNANISGFFLTFRGAVTPSGSINVVAQIIQHIIKINN